jgi:ABC-type lipoprotein release transport system permease subunit
MKFLILLAWKNLFRHRRRTLITAGAIAIGLAMFIMMESLLTGMSRETERNLVWYETAAGKIMRQDFWEEYDQLPLKHAIEDPEPVFRILEQMDIPYTSRVVFRGEVIVQQDPFPEHGSMQLQFAAIDPATDGQVFKLEETVAAGRFLEPGENGIMLGAWLAADLGAEPGYPVTVVTRTKTGYFQTMDLTVVGILNTPNPVINRAMAFIPLGTADTYLQMEGSVTEIDLGFSGWMEPAPVVREIETALSTGGSGSGPGQLTVKSWKELAQDFIMIAGAKDIGNKLILFLVFVIGAVGISNTMLMTVFERTRELGMMRAMGMEDSHIRWCFLLEAAGIGFIGALIGVVMGVLINFFLVNIGIDVSMFVESMDIGYRTTGIMRGIWNPRTIVTAFFAGIVIAVAIAFIPTRKALNMEITDCLRHQ